MAGYSGTSLPKKLGINEGSRGVPVTLLENGVHESALPPAWSLTRSALSTSGGQGFDSSTALPTGRARWPRGSA